MCKDTRIAILPLTYKYPSLFISLNSLIEIAGKQIEFPNIMWEPVPEVMELGKKVKKIGLHKNCHNNKFAGCNTGTIESIEDAY